MIGKLRLSLKVGRSTEYLFLTAIVIAILNLFARFEVLKEEKSQSLNLVKHRFKE